MKSKLTVIILAYNVEKTIERCIFSVLKQHTSFKFKILIGNDGSSDGTVKILNQFKKKFPNVIDLELTYRVEREENSGDYLNFKNLYAKTNTKFFTVLDGDDYYLDLFNLEKK